MNEEKSEYEKDVLIEALATSVLAVKTYRDLVLATIGLFTSLGEDARDPLHEQYVDSYTKLSEINENISSELFGNDMIAELLQSMEEEE